MPLPSSSPPIHQSRHRQRSTSTPRPAKRVRLIVSPVEEETSLSQRRPLRENRKAPVRYTEEVVRHVSTYHGTRSYGRTVRSQRSIASATSSPVVATLPRQPRRDGGSSGTARRHAADLTPHPSSPLQATRSQRTGLRQVTRRRYLYDDDLDDEDLEPEPLHTPTTTPTAAASATTRHRTTPRRRYRDAAESNTWEEEEEEEGEDVASYVPRTFSRSGRRRPITQRYSP